MYEENLLFQDEIPDAICMLPAKIALVSDYTQLLMKLLAAWQKLLLNSFEAT